MGRERIGACLARHATERDCGVRTIERNGALVRGNVRDVVHRERAGDLQQIIVEVERIDRLILGSLDGYLQLTRLAGNFFRQAHLTIELIGDAHVPRQIGRGEIALVGERFTLHGAQHAIRLARDVRTIGQVHHFAVGAEVLHHDGLFGEQFVHHVEALHRTCSRHARIHDLLLFARTLEQG